MYYTEYNIKVFLKENIEYYETNEKLGKLLNEVLYCDKSWGDIHYNKEFKHYVFNNLFPFEDNKVYKQYEVYSFQCRSMNNIVDKIFESNLEDYSNKSFKIIHFSKRKIYFKENIEKIYSLTPIILKNDEGYWRTSLSLSDFENRLKVNIINKYNNLVGQNNIVSKDLEIFSTITIDNDKPISIKYKNISLLGDKVTIYPNQDSLSQKIIFTAIGGGLCENNTIGAGFVNYKLFSRR